MPADDVVLALKVLQDAGMATTTLEPRPEGRPVMVRTSAQLIIERNPRIALDIAAKFIQLDLKRNLTKKTLDLIYFLDLATSIDRQDEDIDKLLSNLILLQDNGLKPEKYMILFLHHPADISKITNALISLQSEGLLADNEKIIFQHPQYALNICHGIKQLKSFDLLEHKIHFEQNLENISLITLLLRKLKEEKRNSSDNINALMRYPALLEENLYKIYFLESPIAQDKIDKIIEESHQKTAAENETKPVPISEDLAKKDMSEKLLQNFPSIQILKHHHLDTPEYINLLLVMHEEYTNTPIVDGIATSLVLLKSYNLLEQYKGLIIKNPFHPSLIAMNLILLEKNGKLTQQVRDFINQYSEHAYAITQGLVILFQEKQINPKDYLNVMTNGLNALKQNNLLNEYIELFSYHPDAIATIAFDIIALNNKNNLTEETKNSLLKKVKYAPQILSTLKLLQLQNFPIEKYITTIIELVLENPTRSRQIVQDLMSLNKLNLLEKLHEILPLHTEYSQQIASDLIMLQDGGMFFNDKFQQFLLDHAAQAPALIYGLAELKRNRLNSPENNASFIIHIDSLGLILKKLIPFTQSKLNEVISESYAEKEKNQSDLPPKNKPAPTTTEANTQSTPQKHQLTSSHFYSPATIERTESNQENIGPNANKHHLNKP